MGKWLFTELYWVSHFPRVRCFLQICSANLWWTICIKNEKSMECWMRWCLILANVDIDSVQSLANVGMHAAFKTRWHCWWIGAQLYKTWRTLRVSRGLRRPTVRPPFRCDGFKRLWIKTQVRWFHINMLGSCRYAGWYPPCMASRFWVLSHQ